MKRWKDSSSKPVAGSSRLLALGAATLLASGCYTYTPVALDVVPVGEEVRLVVTRQGAGQLADEMQLDGAAPELIGTVTGREAGSLLVRVPLLTNPAARAGSVGVAQIARVPFDQVLSVDRRRFSSGRTAAVVAGITGAATVLVLRIIDASGSENPDPGPGPVVSIIRIPIG